MSNSLLTLFSLERYGEHYRTGFWRDDTVYALVAAHAARAPDRVAIRSVKGDLSYRALVAQADAFASELAEKGVSEGQRVAVWSPSRAETVIALLACSRNGYVCCPSLHRDHTVGDILALLARMRAAAIVAEVGYGADAAKNDFFVRLSGLESVRHVYRLERSAPGGAIGIGAVPRADKLQPPTPQNPNRILYLAFTSGTTGMPKGVMHSDNTLLANARALAADWNIDEQSVVYSLSPLSHNLGFGAMIMALAAGGQIVIHDLPRGASLVDRLIETGATFLVGVPTHAVDLLAEMKARNLSGLARLKGFRISGASAPPELVRDLLAVGIVPQSGYGMTETCSHQYTRPDDPPARIVGTCGRACAGYEVRIWRQDDPDVEASPGEIGEIGGRGASLMLGYFDDQSATEAAFNAQGWFMTGDLGWLDEAGYLHITGRKKDIIVRGGRNIYPATIETLALRCAGIEKAAAFAVSDARLGERVCLAVVMGNGVRLDPARLLRDLEAAGLAKYDMPEFLLTVATMPLTPSGKILKRELMRWVAEGQARPIRVRG